MNGRRVVARVAFVLIFIVTVALLPPPYLFAKPATSVDYPERATVTHFSGLAFDTCSAPSLSTMRKWRSSRYRAIGIYIGGVTRACSQRHLNKNWVRGVTAMRWRLVPVYTGKQAPCRNHAKKYLIKPKKARAQGRRAAKHAVKRSARLGLLPGSALYLDIESYPTSRNRCRKAVLRYISGWTTALHKRGYLSGVYVAGGSGGIHLAGAHGSRAFARPDAIWVAQWDGSKKLFTMPGISDRYWSHGQRGKQFRGPHREKHGGVAMTIDSNRFRAPVATVARQFRVTSSVPLKGRNHPTKKSAIITTYRPGSTVGVVCQRRGAKAAGTRVWNLLANGTYVTNRFVNTGGGFHKGLPRCAYPYQVARTDRLNKRAGPGTRHALAGVVYGGGLAKVVCQRRGSNVFGDRVWNKLASGTWVSDYYLATPSRRGFSKPIRRC
ncbi:glycoside hydrolase domain-containing protein [Haloechinothrix halophila]|uniref:glycoside hydrolase domain-containing protein n=1 Tax=Haloechinothrix halophila TaxID=1069073 RepID=UPI0004225225|nr:glycoside hydrolase domain-containing protein [Haloechinothrix halophila]